MFRIILPSCFSCKQATVLSRRRCANCVFYALLIFLLVFAYKLYSEPSAQPALQWTELVPRDVAECRLQQNGNYWIYNNFMSGQNQRMTGNASITLTTHASYMDFKHLEWLVVRWNGPISMAVFVDADTLDQTLESIWYLKYCTAIGIHMLEWVSMHLVFPDNNMPTDLQKLSIERPRNINCKSPFRPQLDWQYENSVYPVNLLQNVARLNAKTYFVFALEMSLLPTKNFIHTFLQFAQQYQPAQPSKSVYCVPVFPQLVENQHVPKYKTELVEQLYYNSSSLSAAEQDYIEELFYWLQEPLQDGEIAVFKVTNSPCKCSGYVSINAYDPLFDQRYVDTNSYKIGPKMCVLNNLNFDFVLLDGTFLIRRKFAREIPTTETQDNSYFLDYVTLNEVALWQTDN